MIPITEPHTKIEAGSYLYFKPEHQDRFTAWANEVIGVVRDYNNETSLSGCLGKIFKVYKISCQIKELEPTCLAWYKNGFLLLTEPTISKTFKDTECDYVKVFKLDNKEIERFNGLYGRFAILQGLHKLQNEKPID